MSAMSGTALRFAAPQASPDQAPARKIRHYKSRSVSGKLVLALANGWLLASNETDLHCKAQAWCSCCTTPLLTVTSTAASAAGSAAEQRSVTRMAQSRCRMHACIMPCASGQMAYRACRSHCCL